MFFLSLDLLEFRVLSEEAIIGLGELAYLSFERIARGTPIYHIFHLCNHCAKFFNFSLQVGNVSRAEDRIMF